MHERGVGIVVITLGARGAWLHHDGGAELVPSHSITVVDTTAAGDAFAAALAIGLAEGRPPVVAAVQFACAAGALAASRAGAQPAMPTRKEVEGLLRQRQPQDSA